MTGHFLRLELICSQINKKESTRAILLNAGVTLGMDNKNKSHYCKQSLLPVFTTVQIIRKWQHNGLGDKKNPHNYVVYESMGYNKGYNTMWRCKDTKDTNVNSKHTVLCITIATTAAIHLDAKEDLQGEFLHIFTVRFWNFD